MKTTKEQTPYISVVMPCYNDGEFILESIESVKAQSITDWELIIIDDGSDDSLTTKVLHSIADERIHLLHTDHKGPSFARNHGIAMARAQYILPLDADDLIDETYLEKSLAILENNPNIGVVYCFTDSFGDVDRVWSSPVYSFDKMLVDNLVFVTALFRKEDWEKVGGFSNVFKHGMEDYDFWLSILEAGKTIYQIPEVLFHYRKKTVSRTTVMQESYDNLFEAYGLLHSRHAEFYKKHLDSYLWGMRSELLSQIILARQLATENQRYKRLERAVQRLNKLPIISNIIKRILGLNR